MREWGGWCPLVMCGRGGVGQSQPVVRLHLLLVDRRKQQLLKHLSVQAAPIGGEGLCRHNFVVVVFVVVVVVAVVAAAVVVEVV